MKKLINENKLTALGVLFALGLLNITLAWVSDKYSAELFLSGLFTVMIVAINSVGLIAEKFENNEDKILDDVIELNLRAVDFKDTCYANPYNCAITKGLRRQLGKKFNVGVARAFLNDNLFYSFNFNKYGKADFDADRLKATLAPDDEIIRTITLTKVEK